MSAIILISPSYLCTFSAGDFVKFGFPMAYTVTVLAWGVIDYESAYSAAGTYITAILNA